jgi:putative endonuclease
MPKQFYVYIMSNKSRTLYTGVTSQLPTRVNQHKDKAAPSFTSRYNIDRLVWAEAAPDAMTAIKREKQLKGWSRAKKIALIDELNPEWRDLSDESVAHDGRDSSLRSE